MTLSTSVERMKMELETPFTIARGTQETAENFVVKISDDQGHTGIGGAAPSAHYGETPDTVAAVLPDLLRVVCRVDDPHQLERIEREMTEQVQLNPAARCAVSIALHDLVCEQLGVPLYRYWGLDSDEPIQSSYTISIDTPDTMAAQAEEKYAEGYSILKVKLGAAKDFNRLEAIRAAVPEATIRVDANEAWSPREAVRKIESFSDFDLEFVEQPVPADNPDGLQFVREHSSLPIAADESCVTVADIPRIADKADIATIKLMKCGGLREARRMITAARTHGLMVMLGCMVESNASIAASAHLAPLLDYADLDGSLLLAEDPFDGVAMDGGHIALGANLPNGTGVRVS